MELRHLRYFVAVARCLSFTKAAEALHISQPPLSRQIQEFEEEVGAALFDRTAKRTTLTDAGAYLLDEAERILDGIEAVCRTARSISQRTRTLKIGCVSFFLSSSLSGFLVELQKKHPELKLEILVMSTEAQEKALLSGALDIGFVRSWISQESLAYRPLMEERLALIYPGKDKLEGSIEERLAALSSRPLIGASSMSSKGLARTIGEICSSYGIPGVPAFECNDAYSIVAMVEAGLGWSILPALEISDLAGKKVSFAEMPQRIGMGMSYRAEALSPEAEEFLDLALASLGGQAQLP